MSALDAAGLRKRIEQGCNYWNGSLDPDVLDTFPAQELIITIPEDTGRQWPAAWQKAGGRLFDGRMIALKDDPIWERISEFRLPYAPFDRYDAVDVQDVDLDEAKSFGLDRPGASMRLKRRDPKADGAFAAGVLSTPPPL